MNLFNHIFRAFGFNAPLQEIDIPSISAQPILKTRSAAQAEIDRLTPIQGKAVKKALFLNESSRQGILIARARRKRKKNGRRPTFKEAGSKIKRIPQSAFGFGVHPRNL